VPRWRAWPNRSRLLDKRRQPTGILVAIRQDLELAQGWLERAAVWLEAGQKKLPEEV
jgi:hypothetical protein